MSFWQTCQSRKDHILVTHLFASLVTLHKQCESPFALFPSGLTNDNHGPSKKVLETILRYFEVPEVWWNFEESVNREHLASASLFFGGFLSSSDSKESSSRLETWDQSLGWEDPLEKEGHGNPLQYSCLENSMDRGAWWATVHGVTKSWTWLSDFYFPLPTKCLSWGKPLDFSVSLPPPGESDAISATEEQDVNHPVGWAGQATVAVLVHKGKVLHVLKKKKKKIITWRILSTSNLKYYKAFEVLHNRAICKD